MRKILYFLTIALIVSSVAAIYDSNGTQTDCESDQPCVMAKTGGSTATATTSVGPNGTGYSSSVEMKGRNPNINDGDRVENISHSENETTFSGYIQAPTPCHVINQETEKLGGQEYRMNIQTVKEDLENESQYCTQQVVVINYEGSFELQSPYSLEIQHNNQNVYTLENTIGEEPAEEPKEGIFSNLSRWLDNLF